MLALAALGLACWVVTMIVVESELVRPLRDWVGAAGDTTGPRHYVAYLLGCHLCAGTWVGLGLALLAPPVIGGGIVGRVLTGLAVKGVAHLLLVAQHLGERIGRPDELAGFASLAAGYPPAVRPAGEAVGAQH